MQSAGRGMSAVSMSSPDNRPVLTRTHVADGRARRTTITPDELPAFEQEIHYVNWLYQEMKSKGG